MTSSMADRYQQDRLAALHEDYVRAEMEALARRYAQEWPELERKRKQLEEIKATLRSYLKSAGIDELIDGETGLGVTLGKPRRTAKWDVEHMPDALVLALARRGLLTVLTSAFDQLRRSGAGALDLDDAQRFRLNEESEPPIQIAAPVFAERRGA